MDVRLDTRYALPSDVTLTLVLWWPGLTPFTFFLKAWARTARPRMDGDGVPRGLRTCTVRGPGARVYRY